MAILNREMIRMILFTDLYGVMVRTRDSLSQREQYTQMFTEESMNQKRPKFVNVKQLAQWYSEGVRIEFIKRRDAFTIYINLNKVFSHFLALSENQFIEFKIPVEELMHLEEFASELRKIAIEFGLPDHLKNVKQLEDLKPSKRLSRPGKKIDAHLIQTPTDHVSLTKDIAKNIKRRSWMR